MSTFPQLCENCGRWFGHVRAWDLHAFDTGCGETFMLRDRGLIQDSAGVWWTSRR